MRSDKMAHMYVNLAKSIRMYTINNPSLFGNKGMLLGNKDMLSDGNQNVWGGDGGDDSLGD
jgi:hypothetical protein